jgi:hypothetical protein
MDDHVKNKKKLDFILFLTFYLNLIIYISRPAFKVAFINDTIGDVFIGLDFENSILPRSVINECVRKMHRSSPQLDIKHDASMYVLCSKLLVDSGKMLLLHNDPSTFKISTPSPWKLPTNERSGEMLIASFNDVAGLLVAFSLLNASCAEKPKVLVC